MSVVVQTDTKESTAQVKANVVAFSKADNDLLLGYWLSASLTSARSLPMYRKVHYL